MFPLSGLLDDELVRHLRIASYAIIDFYDSAWDAFEAVGPRMSCPKCRVRNEVQKWRNRPIHVPGGFERYQTSIR